MEGGERMCKYGTYKKVLVTMQPHVSRTQPYDYSQPWEVLWKLLKFRCFTFNKVTLSQLFQRYKEWLRWTSIDSCVADIVQVFEDNKVYMRASCCGHGRGRGDGYIDFKDYSTIIIPIELTTNEG